MKSEEFLVSEGEHDRERVTDQRPRKEKYNTENQDDEMMEPGGRGATCRCH